MEKELNVYHLNEVSYGDNETLTGDVVMKSDYDELIKENKHLMEIAATAKVPDSELDAAKWLIEKFLSFSNAAEKANFSYQDVRSMREQEKDRLRRVMRHVEVCFEGSYDGKKTW
mgnify:FL=1